MRFFEWDDDELELKTMLEEEEEEEEEGDSASETIDLLEEEAAPVEDYSDFSEVDDESQEPDVIDYSDQLEDDVF